MARTGKTISARRNCNSDFSVCFHRSCEEEATRSFGNQWEATLSPETVGEIIAFGNPHLLSVSVVFTSDEIHTENFARCFGNTLKV